MLRARLAPVLVCNSEPVQGQCRGAPRGALALSQNWVDLGQSQLRLLLVTSASRVMLFVVCSGHARSRQQQLGAAAIHKLPLVRQVTKNRTLNLAWSSNWLEREIKRKGHRNSYVAHIARFACCNMLHQFTAAGTATAANHKVYGLLQSQTVIRSDALMNLSAVRAKTCLPLPLSLSVPLSACWLSNLWDQQIR